MNLSNQNISEKFIQFFKEKNLLKEKFLLAVSGGIDSVVLCELSKQSEIQFCIAHCNFQLRGEEIERDERFVRGLAHKYAVEVFVRKFDTEAFASNMKISVQEA